MVMLIVCPACDILVLDEVLVKAPEYSSKDVQLLSTKKTKAVNEGTLHRVKTIVPFSVTT